MEIDNCTLAPFYEHMQTILNSTPLDLNIKKSSKKRLDFKGSHIFDFTLNFDTIKLLSESRTKSIKLDVRLIIRFCKIINVVDSEGKNLSMRDAFPQHLTIYIDGKPITLSKYLPYDSDRRDGRRNARLIDVTDAVVDAKSLQHQIIIQWVQDDCHEIFSYSLYLVRRRSLHNLSYSLTRSQTCSIKRTASLFRERIYYPSSNKDIEYMVQTIIVKNASLICPISFCRIITPARGTLCTHLQCFDLDTFLLMNFMKPTWICPICDENLYFTCLEIDGLILSILNEKRSQSISEIKFNEEGHWKSNDFIYEDDIDDGNYFGIPKSYSFYKFNENEINKDKIADEISSKLSRKQMNIDLLKLLPPTNWKEYNLPTTILNALSCNEIAIPQSNPNEDIIQTNTPTDVDAPSDNAIIHTTKRNHSDSLTDFPNNSNQNNIPIKKSKLSIKTMQKENITNVNNENAVIESRLDSNFPSDSFHNNNKEIPINKSKLAIRNIPKENITHVNNKKSVEDETKNDSEHLKTLPMKKKSEQSKKFYQYIKILAGKIDKNLKFQFYDSNEKVPNYLRSTDCKMLFWIIEVSNKNPVKLGNICSWGENGVMEIHVVSNGVELFNESNYRLLRKLDEFTTWEVNKTVLNYILKSPSQAGSIIGIEFRENNKDGYNPKVINNIDTLSTEAVLHPSNEDFLHRRSFIRQKLDCDEILKRILFIDATFTVSNADHGRSPLSISILDYNGCEILNTLVTPRSRVNCFGESVHGITELKSREQMDEYDCIRKVHQIVKDRILIGHNMYLKLHHLFIPKYSLMGIRDLATAKVFGKLKVARKLNEQIYALEILKKAFLPNDSNAFLTANSHNNACLIRNIYLAVENEWEDHLPLVPEISSFLADISNNNCSSNTDQSLSTTLKMVTPDFCDNLNGNQILHKPAPSSDVNDDVSDGQQQYCLNNTLATETGQTLELNDESNQLNSLKTNSTAPIGSRILPNPLDNIILSFPIDNSHCNIDIANCQNNDDSDMLSLDELEKVSKPNQSPQDIEFGDYYLDESYIQQSSPDLTVNSDPIPDISEQQILTRNLPFMKSWRISIDLNCNNDDSEGAKITEGVNSDASLLGGNKNHCDNVITGF